jgi:signal transduction histidine kinase
LKDVSYRVIQEAVNNAVRHGDPRMIQVALTFGADELVVSVVNDGAAAAKGDTPSGFGLLGMRERVVACGGVLSFGPGAGGLGWTVIASLPCDSTGPAEAIRPRLQAATG